MPPDPAVALGHNPHGSSLTLKELRYVHALRETLSFNRAAAEMGISQSALSQSIKNIEERLGVVLFMRNRRSVTSTIYSDLIARQAGQVINAMNGLDSQIAGLRETGGGTVSFGIGVMPASLLLNGIMQSFRTSDDGVQLRVVADYVRVLEDLLLRGEIDLFVGGHDPEFTSPACVRESLYEEELVVACRPGHPLVGGGSIASRELIKYPAVSYDTSYLQRQIAQNLEDSEDFELLKRNFGSVSLQDPLLLADFVSTSDFVLLTCRSRVQELLARGRLVLLRCRDLDMGVGIDLVYRNGAALSPASERLAEVVREVAATRQG